MKPSLLYTSCVPALSLSADTKRDNTKEKKRRKEKQRFTLSCSSIRFYRFLFLYIIYYIHTNKRVFISERTQIIRRLEKDIMQSQFKREHSRGNTNFIHKTLLFLAFIFNRVSSFWCLAALRTNTLGGSESVRFEYILLAFSDVPIFRNFVVP